MGRPQIRHSNRPAILSALAGRQTAGNFAPRRSDFVDSALEFVQDYAGGTRFAELCCFASFLSIVRNFDRSLSMHKYVIMGIQGCGKGTQAKMLAKDYDLVHISVGDIFRWHIQSHTKLAARIGRITAAGELVPDEIVEEIVRARLDQHDWNYGFILDGFPRNFRQASFFLESYNIDAVIQIDVTDQVVLDRVLNRRLCTRCGLDYNLIFHRPAEEDVCDVCSGKLSARADDTPAAVRKRLQDYHDKTAPILELFGDKELVVSVDGAQSAEDVQTEIRFQLGLEDRRNLRGAVTKSKEHLVEA
jgi:adenylate kinase